MLKYLLAYDADCGPCTRFKRVVDFLDSRNRISFISLIEAEELGLLNKIPKSLRHASFHLIFPAGEVLSGSQAISRVIESFPSGELISRVLESAPGGPRSIAYLYSVFARLHDAGSCRYQTVYADRKARLGELNPKTSILNNHTSLRGA